MPNEVKERIAQKKPIIFSFWHGRLLLAAMFTPKKMQNNVVISHHKDGQWITSVVQFLGQKIIRGSSSKGGMQALKASLDVLECPQQTLAITPDGPRGPRMRVGGNIVEIAKKSGAPIVAFTYSTKHCRVFKTWDRFILSHPFGKGIAIYGQPHYIKADATKQEVHALEKILEQEMVVLTQTADQKMGLPVIEPAQTQKLKRKGA